MKFTEAYEIIKEMNEEAGNADYTQPQWMYKAEEALKIVSERELMTTISAPRPIDTSAYSSLLTHIWPF